MKRTSFCEGWEFSRDGSAFHSVVVPHDAMLGNERGPNAPAASNSGYYYGASYRYRKHFEVTARQAAGALLLEFEGVYRDARISVNGAEVPAPPYGFIPFFVDLAGLVHEGGNLVEVECANVEQPDCRWYSGAGLHRPVWLWEAAQTHIPPEGVCVTTLGVDPAKARVEVTHNGGVVHVRILDAQGSCIASAQGGAPASEIMIACPQRFTTDVVDIELPSALLWSADAPNLYRCHVELREGFDPESPLLDAAETAFGIRQISWGPNGLFVNGEETLLQGGCIHCDNGVLGAASFAESEERRIRILKEAGFNAVRIAHNPASASLLEACDRLGMYVMDEAWDMWFTRKCKGDYARHFLSWCDHDLRRMVARDYNHPSVIMYSVGNEVADPLHPNGVALEQSLVALLHALDPTRPVTCGLNLAMLVMEHFGNSWYAQGMGVSEPAADTDAPRSSLMFNLAAQATGRGMTLLANVPGADKLVSPALDALDIAGYNYASARYRVDARKHPDRVVVGSETFPYELPGNWRKCREIPNLVGDFMWAAWDYLGEAGAGAWAYTAEEAGFSKPWPWLVAGSGAFDIIGQPNAAAALASAVWGALDTPSIQVRPVNRMAGRTYRATWRGTDAIPSWSWRGCEGERAQVEVYDSRAAAIVLKLNGRIVGMAPVRNFCAQFAIVYEPGTLQAVALDSQGRETGTSVLESATGPLRLEASPETGTARAGGIVYASVSIVGENGQVESNADELLTASVEGGMLLALGSAQPAPTESFLSGAYTTYRGRALAVIFRDKPGKATLTVSGATLAPTKTEVLFE